MESVPGDHGNHYRVVGSDRSDIIFLLCVVMTARPQIRRAAVSDYPDLPARSIVPVRKDPARLTEVKLLVSVV